MFSRQYPANRHRVSAIQRLLLSGSSSQNNPTILRLPRINNNHRIFQLAHDSFHKVQIRFWSAHHHPEGLSSQSRVDAASFTEAAHDSMVVSGDDDGGDDDDNDITTRRQVLIESLAKDVTRNIHEIIRQIDSRRPLPPASLPDSPSRGEERTRPKRHNLGDKPLQDRWNAAVRREKERYRRRHSDAHGRGMENSIHRMTIDELWNHALEAAGMDILLCEHDGSTTSADGPSQVDDKDEQQPDVVLTSSNAANETFSEVLVPNATTYSVSPIFGLPMDERGKVLEGEIPVLDDNYKLSSVGQLKIDGTSIASGPASSTADHSDGKSEALIDTILQVLALFVAARKHDWTFVRGRHESDFEVPTVDAGIQNEHDEQKQTPKVPVHDDDDDDDDDDEADSARELLDYARKNKVMLTSDENNLLLTHLLTSNHFSNDDILEKSLQFFNEMIRLPMVGMEGSGPNSTTYRLMFMGLPRRLDAIGEAAIICKSLAGSSFVELNSETLLEAMRVCQNYSDLDTASRLMSRTMAPDSTVPPTVGSCTAYIDMLKDKNMMGEAVEFYDRVHESKVLRPDIEEELLFQFCRWPNRSRQGDAIDCTSVLLRVMDALFEGVKKDRKPTLQLWVTLVKRLAETSKLDPSLEISINRTLRGILDSYADAWPGNDLLRIGLRASEVTKDAGLIAELIAREVQRKQVLIAKANSRSERGEDDLKHLSAIPQIVFRTALEISLQNTDVESATSILASLEEVQMDYPAGAKSELYGLAVLCYARAARSKEAKELLLSMVEEGIELSDDSFGVVLHSLVVDGKADEARMIFQSMEDNEANLPTPGVSSYNAILVAHIQSKEWDEAISLYDLMNGNGVALNSQTIQGMLLAHVSRDGSKGATAFLEKMLTMQAPVDEATFRLASRIILPALGGKDIDGIRRKARMMGESDPRLRDVSVKMIRSSRTAEVEDKKSRSSNHGRFEPSECWKRALSDLLAFSREIAKTAA